MKNDKNGQKYYFTLFVSQKDPYKCRLSIFYAAFRKYLQKLITWQIENGGVHHVCVTQQSADRHIA